MTNVIKLADKQWEIKPFVIGEQKIVVPMISKVQAEVRAHGLTEQYFDHMSELLLVVIKRVDPTIERAAIEALTCTTSELTEAFLVICNTAGLITKELPPGEAKAP